MFGEFNYSHFAYHTSNTNLKAPLHMKYYIYNISYVKALINEYDYGKYE